MFNCILFFKTNRYNGLLIEIEINKIPKKITNQCIK